jgi:hypothetical protein
MTVYEMWHNEVCEGHRWGQEWSELFTLGLPRELEELETLWKAAEPLSEADTEILKQILSLEICNWRLTDSIIELTEAIGKHTPSTTPIGHRNSVTPDRWAVVLAHQLSLQQYLWGKQKDSAFTMLLDTVDPERKVYDKVTKFLGEPNETKELLVQRLLYVMDWETTHFPWDSIYQKAQNAGIEVIEQRLNELNVDQEILKNMQWQNVDGRLQPCGHKFIRRMDILISSIGAEKWRGQIRFRGTDGLELAATLAEYLAPLLAWIKNDGSSKQFQKELPGATILYNLGDYDPAKLFLARLVRSHLSAQQIEAGIKGQERSSDRPWIKNA